MIKADSLDGYVCALLPLLSFYFVYNDSPVPIAALFEFISYCGWLHNHSEPQSKSSKSRENGTKQVPDLEYLNFHRRPRCTPESEA